MTRAHDATWHEATVAPCHAQAQDKKIKSAVLFAFALMQQVDARAWQHCQSAGLQTVGPTSLEMGRYAMQPLCNPLGQCSSGPKAVPCTVPLMQINIWRCMLVASAPSSSPMHSPPHVMHCVEELRQTHMPPERKRGTIKVSLQQHLQLAQYDDHDKLQYHPKKYPCPWPCLDTMCYAYPRRVWSPQRPRTSIGHQAHSCLLTRDRPLCQR